MSPVILPPAVTLVMLPAAWMGLWMSAPALIAPMSVPAVNFPVIDTINTQEVELKNDTIAAILHDLPASAVSSYASNSSVKVMLLMAGSSVLSVTRNFSSRNFLNGCACADGTVQV